MLQKLRQGQRSELSVKMLFVVKSRNLADSTEGSNCVTLGINSETHMQNLYQRSALRQLAPRQGYTVNIGQHLWSIICLKISLSIVLHFYLDVLTINFFTYHDFIQGFAEIEQISVARQLVLILWGDLETMNAIIRLGLCEPGSEISNLENVQIFVCYNLSQVQSVMCQARVVCKSQSV